MNCGCECNRGGFCGGCGHAGCTGGINLRRRPIGSEFMPPHAPIIKDGRCIYTYEGRPCDRIRPSQLHVRRTR